MSRGQAAFLINFIKGVSDKIWDAFIFLGRREGNMPLWPCMNPAAKSELCLNDGTDVVMLMKLAESSGLLSKEHFAFIYPEETFLGSACPACISGHWLYPQKHAPFDKMMCVLEKLQMPSEICHSVRRRRFGTSTSRSCSVRLWHFIKALFSVIKATDTTEPQSWIQILADNKWKKPVNTFFCRCLHELCSILSSSYLLHKYKKIFHLTRSRWFREQIFKMTLTLSEFLWRNWISEEDSGSLIQKTAGST